MHEHELTKNAIVKGQILIVATSHDKLGDSGQPTGCWLGELAEPFYIFKDAGYDVTLASAKGGAIPIDPGSAQGDFLTEEGKKFLADDAAQLEVKQSVKLSAVTEPEAYDAIYLPGGHGPLWDLCKDEHLGELLKKMNAAGKIISSVCHGPASLLSAKEILNGKKVTGFTNAEEEAVGKTKLVPFLLEDELKAAGGKYACGPDWQSFVQVDGHLVTGQNPGSSIEVAHEVVKLLQAKTA